MPYMDIGKGKVWRSGIAQAMTPSTCAALCATALAAGATVAGPQSTSMCSHGGLEMFTASFIAECSAPRTLSKSSPQLSPAALARNKIMRAMTAQIRDMIAAVPEHAVLARRHLLADLPFCDLSHKPTPANIAVFAACTAAYTGDGEALRDIIVSYKGHKLSPVRDIIVRNALQIGSATGSEEVMRAALESAPDMSPGVRLGLNYALHNTAFTNDAALNGRLMAFVAKRYAVPTAKARLTYLTDAIVSQAIGALAGGHEELLFSMVRMLSRNLDNVRAGLLRAFAFLTEERRHVAA